MTSFFVPGIPVAQGSKKHVGGGIMVEMGKGLKPWRDGVVAMAYRHSQRAARTLTTPVACSLVFTFPRPKAHYGSGKNAEVLKPNAPAFKGTYPDIDKLCRAVLDGLVQGGLIRDDSLVVVLEARKIYGTPHGVRVEVRDV